MYVYPFVYRFQLYNYVHTYACTCISNQSDMYVVILYYVHWHRKMFSLNLQLAEKYKGIIALLKDLHTVGCLPCLGCGMLYKYLKKLGKAFLLI